MRIERLDAPVCEGGENPMWDPRTQKLHYIDNVGRKVHTLDAETMTSRTLAMPDVVTTLVLREGDGAVVTLLSQIHHLDLESGRLERIETHGDAPGHAFNDGKVDARGRFVIGGSSARFDGPVPQGGLFRLDADRRLTRMDSDIRVSNGPCFSPDGQTLYFSDSVLNQTYAYDYDLASGAATNRRPFIDTHEFGGTPDGATVDADGLYWVAVYGSAKIVAYRPDGKVERVIDMPVKLVSSVMFGGPDLDRLFVTTIIPHDKAQAEEEAGSLYVIDGLGVRGLAEHRYAG